MRPDQPSPTVSRSLSDAGRGARMAFDAAGMTYENKGPARAFVESADRNNKFPERIKR